MNIFGLDLVMLVCDGDIFGDLELYGVKIFGIVKLYLEKEMIWKNKEYCTRTWCLYMAST